MLLLSDINKTRRINPANECFTSELVYRSGESDVLEHTKNQYEEALKYRLNLIGLGSAKIAGFIRQESKIFDIGYFELDRQERWRSRNLSDIKEDIRENDFLINLLSLSELIFVAESFYDDVGFYPTFYTEKGERERRELGELCEKLLMDRFSGMGFNLPQARAYANNENLFFLSIPPNGYDVGSWTESSTKLILFDDLWGKWEPGLK